MDIGIQVDTPQPKRNDCSIQVDLLGFQNTKNDIEDLNVLRGTSTGQTTGKQVK